LKLPAQEWPQFDRDLKLLGLREGAVAEVLVFSHGQVVNRNGGRSQLQAQSAERNRAAQATFEFRLDAAAVLIDIDEIRNSQQSRQDENNQASSDNQ
jgi:hypothetical protein